MLFKLVLTATLVSALAAGAEPENSKSFSKKAWWGSVAALATATALDAQSSWGRREANPLLPQQNGNFGAGALALKVALAGGGLLLQWRLLRHQQKLEKELAIVNAGVAAGLTGVAVHNYRVK